MLLNTVHFFHSRLLFRMQGQSIGNRNTRILFNMLLFVLVVILEIECHPLEDILFILNFVQFLKLNDNTTV